MELTSENLPSNKKFGYFFSVIFFTSAIYLFYKGALTLGSVLCSLSFIFFLLSIFKDHWLLTLNKLWMSFGVLLGMIISPIVLAILFFFMFTPIAIAMRMFKRDELMLKPSNADSFWKLRDQNSLSAKSFNQQF